MDIFHKIYRLKYVSKREIPRMIRSKFSRFFRSQIERILYTPSGPRFPKAAKPVRPIGIFHPDVSTGVFVPVFQAAFAKEAAVLRREADQNAEMIVDLLGSGPVELKKRGDDFWHEDFKSGFKWNPRSFFTDIVYGNVAGADVKIPWELSRAQHFVTLAQAYVLTKDEKYARAYFEQVESWIRRNPPKFGVNWACPMDVALRAGNWLAAWDVFQHSKSVTPFFQNNFAPFLWEHGHHIRHHLEWGADVSSNHYLSDLIGLFNIGLALEEPEWVDYAQAELARELFRQTHDDGFDYEGSTMYHRLVLEIFLFYVLVCARNHGRVKELGAVFLERVAAMFEVAHQLSAHDGTIPSIGDNDSGRVHVFSRRNDDDMRYLPSIGFLLLGKAPLKIQEWDMASEAGWLFGLDGFEKFRAAKGLSVHQIRSKKLSRSGLITLRGGNDQFVFCVAPNGTRGIGNHTHNDKLSFCLWANGEWFFVDPGTGVYTPDPSVRNKFRSTRAHNTVVVDGQEQNRIVSDSLFALGDDAKVKVEEGTSDVIAGASHNGYQRLGVIHHRLVERVTPLQWSVSDRLEGGGAHQLEWNFHLAPDLHATVEGAGVRIAGHHGHMLLTPSNPELRTEIVPDQYSPHYGVIDPSDTVRFALSTELPFQVKFEIVYSVG